MNDYKLLPVEPTQDMLSRVMNIVTGYSGEYGQYNNYLDEETAREMYAAFLADTPAVQMEVVGWQFYEDGKWWNGDDRIKDHRKNTKEGGYPIRDVYATQQPVEQSTFTVGTDLSDGRLTVVVMRHENNITWVIHTEIIQLAEQQSNVTQLAEALEQAEQERDFLIAEYERAVGCGAQGFAHAAGHLFNAITNAKADTNTEYLMALRDERDALKAELERECQRRFDGNEQTSQEHREEIAGLVEALEEIRDLPSVRQDEAAFIAGSALDAHHKQGGEV